MLKNINYRIETLKLDIISLIVSKNNIPYDQVEEEFINSLTYKLLCDTSTGFYLLDNSTLFEIWTKEVFLKESITKFPYCTLKELTKEGFREQLEKEDIYNNKYYIGLPYSKTKKK